MIRCEQGVIKVDAPITMSSASVALQTGLKLITPEVHSVDLGSAGQPDSAALAVLFAWQRKAAEYGVRLQVRNAPPGLLSLGQLYGVNEVLPLA